jgi:predicted PurR-regulated permease PerM
VNGRHINRALAAGPIVWLGIIIVTCLLLVLFQTVLWLVMPVLLAVVAYYILSPLVKFGISKGLSRSRAVLITTLLMTAVLVLICFAVAPKVSSLVHTLPDKIQAYSKVGYDRFLEAERTLDDTFHFRPKAPAAPVTPTPPKNLGFVSSEVVPTAPTAVEAAPKDDVEDEVAAWQSKYSGDIALELAHWIPSLLLVPYITYFFLLDGPRFKRFLVQAIPNAFFEKTLYLFYRVEDQIRRYFQGLLALTALDALCLGIGLWILGLHEPFLLAVIAAVMAWLPYLGSIGGGVLVALVAAKNFPDSPYMPYEVVGLFICVRLLDDFVFMPLTVGRSLHMHPLVTVLMILLGGAVAGVSGLLLVMPVLGVVMVAGQIVGELITDERILARHRHAKQLSKQRARHDLLVKP